MYPIIEIERIRKPNRWYAFPLLGFFVKLVMIIPVSIELSLLRLIVFFVSILNAGNIFFRGRYWKWAYDINLGVMQFETNISYFLYGLTDRYPGFSLTTTSDYTLKLSFNKNPNRLYATPLLGVVIRTLLLLPYLLYRQVVNMAAFFAILFSWIPVLIKRRYPETTYELARDSVRIDQAVTAYFLGMSDTYPSWWISMKHKPLKILLLILAALFTLWSFGGNWTQPSQQKKFEQNLYRYGATQTITPTTSITPTTY